MVGGRRVADEIRSRLRAGEGHSIRLRSGRKVALSICEEGRKYVKDIAEVIDISGRKSCYKALQSLFTCVGSYSHIEKEKSGWLCPVGFAEDIPPSIIFAID